jgi:hypothetical protein
MQYERAISGDSPQWEVSGPEVTSMTPISDSITDRLSGFFGQSSVLSGPDLPNWVSHVKDQLISILHLQEGWDGFGAGPIRHDVLYFALAILRQIMRSETLPPHITPMSHEGVQLEWHTDAIDLEIEIEEPGSAWVSYENRLAAIEDDWEVSTEFSSLSDPVEQLTAKE